MIARVLTLPQFAEAARRGGLVPLGTRGLTAVGSPGDTLTIPAAARQPLTQLLVSDVKTRFTTGTAPDGTPWRPLRYPRPSGGNKPLNDTGVLRESIHGTADEKGVTLQTTHPGAGLHNAGGVVRKKSKMLAIPLTKEARRSGGPRRFKGKLGFRPTGRNRVFVLVSEVKGKPVGQFLLVDQVVIPRREFMGISEKGMGYAGELVADFLIRQWASEDWG